MVGEKEVVTKEWENEDCCVGDRKEKMAIERNSHVVAANILMELLCVCTFVWGIFYVCVQVLAVSLHA